MTEPEAEQAIAMWQAGQSCGDLRQVPELKPLPAVTSLGAKGCQYIYGDVPKWPDEPVMCGRARRPGSAYCKDHDDLCTTAFVPRGLRGSRRRL